MKRIISFGVVMMLIIFVLGGCDKGLSNIRDVGATPEPTAASEAPESTQEQNFDVSDTRTDSSLYDPRINSGAEC